MHHKRLRVEASSLPRTVISAAVATNSTVPSTPPAVASPQGGLVPLPAVAERGNKPEDKVQAILERHGKSFCEELGADLVRGGPDAFWKWFCASIIMTTRIKSNSVLVSCQAVSHAGLGSHKEMLKIDKEECQGLLQRNGFERCDEKTAKFLVDNAKILNDEYQGDFNHLRESAGRIPKQERILLKKFPGVGDGGVDIFFREVQLVWDEIFPFADKKALRAARLVGIKECHPKALAELCGNDRAKYVKLIASLVRIELTNTFHEF